MCAIDNPESVGRIPVLAYELAHRTPYVRRRALLQSEEVTRGNCRRHARATHALGKAYRDIIRGFRGDFASAGAQGEKALRLAEASLAQARTEEGAWQDRFPKPPAQ